MSVPLRDLRVAGIVAMFWLFAAASASGQNLVYHSPNDDGANPGTALQLPIGPDQVLFLYLDTGSAGSQNGIACNDGDGRELCGYSVTIDAIGGALFTDFIAESNVIHFLIPTQLSVNGTFSLSPSLGPVRIGELRVASSQQGSEVMVRGGEAVLAALQVESVSQSVLAVTPVPEPTAAIGLSVGMVALALLAKKRRMHARKLFGL